MSVIIKCIRMIYFSCLHLFGFFVSFYHKKKCLIFSFISIGYFFSRRSQWSFFDFMAVVFNISCYVCLLFFSFSGSLRLLRVWLYSKIGEDSFTYTANRQNSSKTKIHIWETFISLTWSTHQIKSGDARSNKMWSGTTESMKGKEERLKSRYELNSNQIHLVHNFGR